MVTEVISWQFLKALSPILVTIYSLPLTIKLERMVTFPFALGEDATVAPLEYNL
jgi:hypothetical protein